MTKTRHGQPRSRVLAVLLSNAVMPVTWRVYSPMPGSEYWRLPFKPLSRRGTPADGAGRTSGCMICAGSRVLRRIDVIVSGAVSRGLALRDDGRRGVVLGNTSRALPGDGPCDLPPLGKVARTRGRVERRRGPCPALPDTPARVSNHAAKVAGVTSSMPRIVRSPGLPEEGQPG
jgi:hypothetical protein